jgi:hypothetical protein
MEPASVTTGREAIPVVPTAFGDRSDYLAFCNAVARVSHVETESPLFEVLLKRIQSEQSDAIISTPWGGVVIESLRNNDTEVKKNLVVKQGMYLAFEKHDEKVETLSWKEGKGVLVYRSSDEGALQTAIIEEGFEITLRPGQEHTIIAISNLVVWEESLDPKGMDRDLIFIFEP